MTANVVGPDEMSRFRHLIGSSLFVHMPARTFSIYTHVVVTTV